MSNNYCVFIRHGHSLTQGTATNPDDPLHEKGIEQAIRCQDWISKNMPQVDHVFASPLTRVLETATHALAKRRDLIIHAEPELREFASYQRADKPMAPRDTGKVFGQLKQSFPHVNFPSNIADDAVWWEPHGGRDDVYLRLYKFAATKLFPLVAAGKKILVFCHGNVMKALLGCAVIDNATPMKVYFSIAPIPNPPLLDSAALPTMVPETTLTAVRSLAQIQTPVPILLIPEVYSEPIAIDTMKLALERAVQSPTFLLFIGSPWQELYYRWQIDRQVKELQVGDDIKSRIKKLTSFRGMARNFDDVGQIILAFLSSFGVSKFNVDVLLEPLLQLRLLPLWKKQIASRLESHQFPKDALTLSLYWPDHATNGSSWPLVGERRYQGHQIAQDIADGTMTGIELLELIKRKRKHARLLAQSSHAAALRCVRKLTNSHQLSDAELDAIFSMMERGVGMKDMAKRLQKTIKDAKNKVQVALLAHKATGETLLHLASKHDNLAFACMLIVCYGSHPLDLDGSSQTPLMLAKSDYMKAMMNMFLHF